MSIKKKIKKYRIERLSPNTDSTNSMPNEISHGIKEFSYYLPDKDL